MMWRVQPPSSYANNLLYRRSFVKATVGTNEYVIGRPFVTCAVLNLPNGKRFVVTAKGMNDANRYSGSIRLNG